MKRHKRIKDKPFTALLLFQYHFVPHKGKKSLMRLCERTMFTFKARNARDALRHAKHLGKIRSFKFGEPDKYGNVYSRCVGGDMFFEFVGVLDLVELVGEPERSEGEVWYDMPRIKAPMERAKKLIPDERSLRAFL